MIPPSVLVATVSAVIVLGLNAPGAKSVMVQMDYIKFVNVVCLIQVVRHVMMRILLSAKSALVII